MYKFLSDEEKYVFSKDNSRKIGLVKLNIHCNTRQQTVCKANFFSADLVVSNSSFCAI